MVRLQEILKPAVNLSEITPYLHVGTAPASRDYETLRALNVRLVINMRFGYRPARDPHHTPLRTLWLPVIDSPLTPIPIRVFQIGARAALSTIAEGGAVYTHCTGGVHRGPAMGAAILIAQGYPAEEALLLIKQRRPGADPGAWYIKRRILRFAETIQSER